MNRITLALVTLVLCAAMPGWTATKEDRRAEVRENTQRTLDRLYQLQPKAKAAVEKSAGYAVFSNFGMKLLMAGGGTGQGLAVELTAKGTKHYQDDTLN